MIGPDFECRYCGAVFPKRMDNGACPCCSAPNPKRLEETPQKVIVINNYHYIERPPSRTNSTPRGYYISPNRNLKSKLYSAVGFKIATGLIVAVVILMIYLFIQAFEVGEKGDLNKEELRYIAPTAQIIESAEKHNSNQLDDGVTQWLTSSESMELQKKTNVVNLIFIDSDEIKIATYTTLQLDKTWKQTKPYFIEAVSRIGTAVVVQIGGTQYNINTYQPFVWQGAPQMVTMIDTNGMIWVQDAEKAVLVEMGSFELPILINPNPKMEISYSKQQ